MRKTWARVKLRFTAGKGELAGAYVVADLVVAGKIILELKSIRQLTACMEAQLINYLRLSKVPVGYLINFRSTKVKWRRFINSGGRYPFSGRPIRLG